MANRPVDRLQAFLAAIAGDESAPELTPRDQMEYYLAKMAERIGNIQPGQAALYPLHNGSDAFGNLQLEISNGNHVKLLNTAAQQQSSDIFFNLHTCEVGGSTVVNNKPLLFTLPAGKTAVLRLYNIVNPDGVVFAANVRLANTSYSGTLSTGDAAHTGEVTVTKTPPSDVNASCLFVFSRQFILQAASVEFDVELTVDGQRWI